MNKRKRLDILLVERNLAATQKEAQSLVLAGKVFSGSTAITKAGTLCKPDIDLHLKSAKPHNYVSRGGVKLAHALKHFVFDPINLIAIDVGCSTGGFSDVLLHHSVKKIYAVDVGYGEFDWKLRCDPRITLLERTNARHLSRELIQDPLELIVCDASFISLTQVLPAAMALAAPGCTLIALIKPQFEVAKHQVESGGIIRNSDLHASVISKIENWLTEISWDIVGVTPSPILGAKGNREFLIMARNG